MQHVQKKLKKTEAEQERQAGRKSGIIWRNSEWTRDYRRVLIGWVNFLHRLRTQHQTKGTGAAPDSLGSL